MKERGTAGAASRTREKKRDLSGINPRWSVSVLPRTHSPIPRALARFTRYHCVPGLVLRVRRNVSSISSPVEHASNVFDLTPFRANRNPERDPVDGETVSADCYNDTWLSPTSYLCVILSFTSTCEQLISSEILSRLFRHDVIHVTRSPGLFRVTPPSFS